MFYHAAVYRIYLTYGLQICIKCTNLTVPPRRANPGAIPRSDHISVLKERAQKKLNVVKCMSRAARGFSSSRGLLRLALSTVISTLNFGSLVYLTACSTSRKTPELIQNAALRIATGSHQV